MLTKWFDNAAFQSWNLLYEVEKKIIRGASVVELINAAKEKFCLPGDNYKICLEEDKTEVDDDDVLLEYAEQCERHARPPVSLLLKAQNYCDNQENTENDRNILNDNIKENSFLNSVLAIR
ncbi:uncharacterized protein LOC117170715 [Belonocnema kinseyi]|uniref:uncharacterized protein LOC117170715 n=1 Tax=Belonocnema kinseyi TaxID=2817044 RepID=UPI00143D62BA|nr:uncharacterized protein LOC117170715 [Belonocnema kinseyi]